MRNTRSRNRRGSSVTDKLGVTGVVIVLLVIVVGLTFGCSKIYAGTETTVTSATVDSKERVCDKDDCKYLVFTDKGTFAVTDSLFIGRTNSSDVYGRIKEDHTYNFRVIGWRSGIGSSYQNIIEATEVQG